LAAAISLADPSKARDTFFDLAAKSNGQVPSDIVPVITENEAVPLLLRTIGNRRLSATDVQKLVSIVRGIQDDRA
jgi:hypothetical protein